MFKAVFTEINVTKAQCPYYQSTGHLRVLSYEGRTTKTKMKSCVDNTVYYLDY